MSSPASAQFLVVEDSYADFLLLERELRRQGIRARLHRVETLPDLQQALAGHAWDIVLADYHVPGLPFARALQTVQETQPDCPVVIVSGEVGEEVAVEQLKLGAADFVLKDRPARLGQVVQRAINDANARIASREAQRQLHDNAGKLQQAATVFDNVREGVLITDPAGVVVATNPAFLKLGALSAATLIGCALPELTATQPGDELLPLIWNAMSAHGDWQGEIAHRPATDTIGNAYWLSVTLLRAPDGAVRNRIALLTDISRLRRSEQQLQHLAGHDPLTDLPNRLQLMDSLRHAIQRARRTGGLGALLFLDLDRFKIVNDSKGHPVGDELLKLVALRLRETLRETDTLARLGGDEFVVVLEDLPASTHAARVAQNLIDQLNRSFVVGHEELVVGLSIGISLFPEESKDPNEVIQHADTALYQAKANGGGRFCFYTRELTDAVNERQALDVALRRALSRREFELHYQPLVDLRTGVAYGAEALVRWRDPERGVIAPDRFVPYAEDSGLIVPIGDWILRAACTQLVAWQAAGVDLQSLAVNLSPRQFAQEDIVGRIVAILRETGVAPERLVLELTESALKHRREDAISKLVELRQIGVRIAIDDFGVDYSCFHDLRRLPISILKIDKSFLHDVPADTVNSKLVAAIVSMGRIMGLDVVAEGVEQPAQLAFLRHHGCDFAQGFLLAHAVPAADLPAALLAAGNRMRAHQPARIIPAHL